MSKLPEDKRLKQKEALKRFHADPNKPTSAGVPRPSRSPVATVSKQLSALSGPSINLIGKAILGELVPERSVWKGTDKDKQDLLKKDPSVKFEFVELEPGIEVEMMVEWVKVPETKLSLAKWILAQDIATKKAAEESKLRKIEAALKQKKAETEGALPTPEQQAAEQAKSFGGPKLVTDYVPPENEETED